jgi:hypothetical protein
MKIELSIELDIPGIEDWSNEEISQNIFDDYINYATVSHLQDAVKWCAISGSKKSVDFQNETLIFKHHELWGDICRNAKWTLEKVE